MLHDKLQLKISVFFLFCYFLYQKLCLGFWSGTKSKNSWKQGMCQWSGLWIWMAHEAGTLWVGPQKRLKKQCCSSPFPLSSFGKLLLSFLYYILWTTYIVTVWTVNDVLVDCVPSMMSCVDIYPFIVLALYGLKWYYIYRTNQWRGVYRPRRHWRSTLYYVQHQSIRQPDLIAVHTSHTYQIHSNTAEYIT